MAVCLLGVHEYFLYLFINNNLTRCLRMKTNNHFRGIALAFGLSLLCANAQASITISGAQVGDDFVFSYSGTLDTSGLTTKGSTNGLGLFGVTSTRTYLAFGVGPALQGYDLASFAPISSDSNLALSGPTTGGGFSLFTSDTLALPPGYVSGDSISGTLTLLNQDFTSLSLIAGTYQRNLPSGDFVRIVIDSPVVTPAATAVPTVSAYGLALAMLGLVLVASRRLRASVKRR